MEGRERKQYNLSLKRLVNTGNSEYLEQMLRKQFISQPPVPVDGWLQETSDPKIRG